MIPPKLKPPGRSASYDWSQLSRIGGSVSGSSRESLLRCAKSYFGKRKKKYRFTTRKEEDGTFTIYRTK